MVEEPATQASSGSFSEMQSIKSHTRLMNQNLLAYTQHTKGHTEVYKPISGLTCS